MGQNKLKKIDSFEKIKAIEYSSKLNYLLKVGSLFLIGLYRTFGTQFLGGNCRFTPSCSQYAQEAFHRHSFICAFKIVLIRLIKCHPFGPFGYDPVPGRNCNARTTK
jgi:uncharacterized protein